MIIMYTHIRLTKILWQDYGTYFVSKKFFQPLLAKEATHVLLNSTLHSQKEQHCPVWMQAGALKMKIALAISSYIWI